MTELECSNKEVMRRMPLLQESATSPAEKLPKPESNLQGSGMEPNNVPQRHRS